VTELDEVFFANGNVEDGEGGDPYIWKTVLTEGRLELTPGPGGKKVKKPLVIVDGHSSDPTKAIGLADLLDSFEKGVFQHVTVPTSHANQVTENTGFVRQMRLAQENGKNVLQAAFEFTEPEIREKVRRGTIANVSCGILRNYEKPRDGSTHSAVIEHIALTNKPWVDGMTPFFNQLSDDEGVAEGYHFADQSEEDVLNFGMLGKPRDNSAIVKKAWIKREVDRSRPNFDAHAELRQHVVELVKAGDPNMAAHNDAIHAHNTGTSAINFRRGYENSPLTPNEHGALAKAHMKAIKNPNTDPALVLNHTYLAAHHANEKRLGKSALSDENSARSKQIGISANLAFKAKRKIGIIPKTQSWPEKKPPKVTLSEASQRRLNFAAYGDAAKGDMFDYSAKGYEDITDGGSTLVKWDDNTGMVSRQHALEDTLDSEFPDYMLLDYSGGRVLIEDEDGTRYIAGYRMKADGSVELHPQAEWQKLSDNRSELSDDNTEGG